jgi:hypothetical protein
MEYIVYNMERHEVLVEYIQNDMQWKISCIEYTVHSIGRVDEALL